MNIRSLRRLGVLAATPLAMGCATSVESGVPLDDPAAIAARLGSEPGLQTPANLRFAWRYGDRRGDVEGDGVGRFNPPDSLRIDLFTSGDVAMAIASAGGRLTSRGQIEDVDVPPRPFIFAMAGMFRPDSGPSPRAFVNGADSVLVYGPIGDRTYVYHLERGRLGSVEERRRDRVLRRVRVEWSETGVWPVQAEYRDFERPSRVRWEIENVQSPVAPHPGEIYALPYSH
ncbi:MAG: hypothetical protein P8125_02115 [Gemmatimonadota bacterium]